MIVLSGELKDSCDGYAEINTKFDNRDVSVEIGVYDNDLSENVFPEFLEKFKDKIVKITIEELK